MINKNAIGQAIITKIEDASLISQIAYENDEYVPPIGTTIYALVAVIPALERPQSNCEEMALFSIDIDIYVEANAGTYEMREMIQDIGELFNPTSTANTRWIIGAQQLAILSTEEVQGAKTEDGWYYSTLRLNLKVSK